MNEENLVAVDVRRNFSISYAWEDRHVPSTIGTMPNISTFQDIGSCSYDLGIQGGLHVILAARLRVYGLFL